MAESKCTGAWPREIGYMRVSSDAQDTALQMEAMRRAGVELMVQEKKGGDTLNRPELERALRMLQPGDVLVVYKVDRLARSLFDLLSVIRRLGTLGAGLRSLTEPIDTSSALGELVLQILGAIAQFELALIRERVRAGKAAAMARGVVFGRRRYIDYSEAQRLREGGQTYADIGRLYGVAGSSVRSALLRLTSGATTVNDPRRGAA